MPILRIAPLNTAKFVARTVLAIVSDDTQFAWGGYEQLYPYQSG